MGIPPLTMPELIDRWTARAVVLQGECWIWTKSMTSNGYATMPVRGVCRVAHRVFYEYFIAEIPAGLELDHLCRVRHCVNPWHMDPVTRSVNLKRATPPKHNRSKTHCPQGHPYDEENTLRIPSRPNARYCLTCNREQSRARRARNRQAREVGAA